MQRGTPGSGIGGAQRPIVPRARSGIGVLPDIRGDFIAANSYPTLRPARCPAAPGRSRIGVPICMRRGAQLWADQGWRLFEPQASLARPRPKRAPQVPVAPAEGADSWGAFLWVTFLWRSKKGDCAAGRNSRPTMLASTQKTLFRYRPSRRTARRGQSPIAGQEHAFTASSRRAMGI